MTDSDVALQYAIDHYDADTVSVDYLGVWNGYQVYAPVLDTQKYTGLPISILVSGGIARFTTPEETWPCFDYFARD